MMKYYLAIDIGASSGRHILSYLEDGRIRYEEIYRFYNGMDEKNGHKVWDTKRLFDEILAGMKKCAESGRIPVSMGIDTWGVDYVLLDENDKILGNSYAYRDGRTEGMDGEVYKIIPEKDLYARTGIQKAIFNTIYQLMAVKKHEPHCLEKAASLLMIPDYLNFLLTGVKKQEYTNATTTQLVDPKTNEWDAELIEKLGFPSKLFKKLSMPGTYVGELSREIIDKVGFNCIVVLPATHDTGSAVMSVPNTSDDVLYISSGTWSLFGCELEKADCSEKARSANFTNEGGYDHRYRFLKNIMGLWMIQSVKKEFEEGYEFPGKTGSEDYSFANLCEMAEKENIDSVIDAGRDVFLAPKSMIVAVKEECKRTGQQVPVSPWEISRVIYRSLAECYKNAAKELEEITGKHFDTINIVGGGSNADYLNRLTAKETGKTVAAGPSEATAIGNIGAQMIADGLFSDIMSFRKSVYDSFGVKLLKHS
ncbi:MAG: rhamnulokinase [Butyrivibrio sp.]|nr:rhamnulokinase [Butyrivibrio sp.]